MSLLQQVEPPSLHLEDELEELEARKVHRKGRETLSPQKSHGHLRTLLKKVRSMKSSKPSKVKATTLIETSSEPKFNFEIDINLKIRNG